MTPPTEPQPVEETADQALVDGAGAAPRTSALGTPGPPLARNSAFYRGLWGAAGAILAVAVALAVREVASVVIIVLVSIFLAVGLTPIVELLTKLRLPRGLAVLVVAVGVVGVVALIVIVLVSLLRDQVSSFIDHAPRLLHQLLRNKAIRNLNHKYHVITRLQNKLKDPNLTSELLGDVFSTGLNALQDLASVVVVFVLTLYFLAGLPTLKHALYSLAPASRRPRVAQLADEILRRTGRYVIGAFLVALLAGTVTLCFLLIVGLGQYALPLALVVALLDLVPLVGSITGASLVTLVCLANSLHLGIAAAIFYLVYEVLEGYVIYPRVMRSSVDVPEYVTIIAVLAGGALEGIIGALLALPIGAALLLLVRELWVQRQDTR
jgi:predicted PurR-regulated permease PerM